MVARYFLGGFGGQGSDKGETRGPSRQQRRRLERRQRSRRDLARVACAGESLESRALLAGVVADYTQLAFWGGGAQGGVVLENQGSATVENWTATFDFGGTIASIWDAEIVSRENGGYTVQGPAWNPSLEPGEKISFGFVATAAHPNLLAAPASIAVNGGSSTTPPATDPDSQPSQPNGWGVYARTGWWGNGLNGGVLVTNTSSATSTGWTASFDFDGEIIDIWNARIRSQDGSRYVIEDVDYNGAVAPGGSASFGFTARINSINVAPGEPDCKF